MKDIDLALVSEVVPDKVDILRRNLSLFDTSFHMLNNKLVHIIIFITIQDHISILNEFLNKLFL